MRKFTKGGVTVGCDSDFKARIFLADGWNEVGDKAPASKPVEKADDTPNAEYTAEDIEKMPYMKLKSVAKQNGIDAEGRDAKEVRAEVIEKLGL